jgi:hypothetical protein
MGIVKYKGKDLQSARSEINLFDGGDGNGKFGNTGRSFTTKPILLL